MLKANWMALSMIGLLLSAASFADDATSSNTDGASLPIEISTVQSLLAEPTDPSGWRLTYPIEAMTYSDDWRQPIANVDFQDASAFARISKLRNLSLLTLAEFGEGRLFLGVNSHGLVGLHFNAFPRNYDGRYLELARMPYLKKEDSDSADRKSGQESK